MEGDEMKKIAIGLGILLVIAMVMPVMAAPLHKVTGGGNGGVDSEDVSRAMQLATSGAYDAGDIRMCDINSNGKVDADDAFRILLIVTNNNAAG